MRKSLSIVAVLVLVVSACYENPNNPVRVGPFGVNLAGAWTLSSITGTQTGNPTAAGPLPLVTSVGNVSTQAKGEILSATMTMLYDQEKDWEMHLSYRATLPGSGLVVLTDSVRRGNYFTTTDASGATSITMIQNTPFNAYFTGVMPSAGGVSADLKTITVHGGLYTTTVLPTVPNFLLSNGTLAANASPFVWVWTKQ